MIGFSIAHFKCNKQGKKRKKIVNFITLFVVFQAFFGLLGCANSSAKTAYKKTSFALDTTIEITYYDSRFSGVISEGMKLVSDYEKVFSRTNPESELYRVNHSKAGEEIEISEDLYGVLETASFFYELSTGAFDVTLGGVSSLYDFSGAQNVPDGDALTEAMKHTGMSKYSLISPNRIVRSDEATEIDLGGIAKGYIADRVKEFLVSKGVTNALINLGGNLLAVGEKPLTDGTTTPFTVGIQTPEKGASTFVKTLSLSDASLVTSGTYERAFTRDGIFYHHLLDATTGRPFDTLSSYDLDVVSVTISGPSSMICDALSTSVFFMGSERAKTAISALPGYHAYILLSSGEIIEIGGN